jgi:arginine/lysine/ornithine decarboxylase
MERFRTYLIRGGTFNGLRITCQKSTRPGTVILFKRRCCDEAIHGIDTGELYELDRRGVEYVLQEDEEEEEVE